jgi:methionyl-tRNA synthetase
VIGKDIVRFHAVYWPAFLLSAGVDVPRRIFSHGFLFNRGEKMSKSVGNVIDPFALADAYGVDQLRYFFLREVPFGQDGNYSHEAIVHRVNADLANDLGNLAQRSLSMVARQLGGVLPKPGALNAADKAMLALADGMISAAREAMQTQQLHQILNLLGCVARANRYFAGEAPRLGQATRCGKGRCSMLQPRSARWPFSVSPSCRAGGETVDLLAIPATERQFRELGGARRIASGAALPAPTAIFPRYVDSEASAQK